MQKFLCLIDLAQWLDRNLEVFSFGVIMEKFYKCLATFFYLGFSPYAPGTVGTMGSAIIYAILWSLNLLSFWVMLIFITLASVATIKAGTWAENYFQRKDPKQVVIDEVAGFFLTVLFFSPSIWVLLSGFVIFRLFDIAKPYPIKKLESIRGGLGILVDDLMAAVYGLFVLLVISWLVYFWQISIDIQPLLWQWKSID